MTKTEIMQKFVETQSVQAPLFTFIVGFFITALLAWLLGYIYVKYGKSISNRRMFARNFLLVSLTTMFIITVVKSSLALSLGLVGALSIIRFRTAIKEPEELAYLFMAISMGLGMGADQWIVTLVASLALMFVIFLKHKTSKTKDYPNLYLSIASDKTNAVSLTAITDVLRKYAIDLSLKRYDETKEKIEVAYLLNFIDFEKMNQSKKELLVLNDSLKITFLDNRGIY